MEEYGFGGHSIFAPSGSAMWLTCSGSLIANLLEEDEGSFEAAEGTVAHELAEQWLKSGIRPDHRLGEEVWVQEKPGKPIYEVTIDEVMLDWVEEYVNWCITLPGEHYVEQKVWFTELMPDANADELEEDGEKKPIPFVPQGGTADHAACMPGKLIISDLKYGKGIFVEAVDNTQARLYALGFFYLWDWLYDFQEITIRIGQPRMFNWGEWTVTREELLEYAEFVRERAAAAWKIDAPRKVSEKGCQWCKAKYDCAANAAAMDALAYADLDMLDEEVDAQTMSWMKDKLREEYKMHTAATSRLSDEEMVKILKYRKSMEQYFQRLFDHLVAKARGGVPVPGKKLAAARSNRQWKNPGEVHEHLIFLGLTDSDIFKTEIISPAQMEEVLRTEAKYDRNLIPGLLRDYIYQPPGKPTLVDDNDPRPAIGDMDEGAWDD